jgi:hypothetical protein
VNCRDVEVNVFTKPKVEAELSKFVLVRLYVDGGEHATPAEGEKNFDYEDKTFGELSQPIYGIIESDGKVVGKTDYTIAKNVNTMAAWLAERAK